MSSIAMVNEAEAVARAAIYDEGMDVADPSLPDDQATVKNLNEKCERLLDNFKTRQFRSPVLTWTNGFVNMEWFGLPQCECVLEVRNDAYVFIASKHQVNKQPTQSYSATYGKRSNIVWIVDHIIYTLETM